MKYFLHLLLLLPFFCNAQNDSLIEYSKLQKMIMQPVSFVKLQFDTVGTTDDLHIGLVTATSLKDGSTERSICFIANPLVTGSMIFSENNIQIPVDELSRLIDALTIMKSASETKPEQEKYQFVSSNFTVLKLENRIQNNKRWDLFLYSRFRNINAPIPGSLLQLHQRNIISILTILQRLRDQLGNNLYKKL
jgi:hypothetical protein